MILLLLFEAAVWLELNRHLYLLYVIFDLLKISRPDVKLEK